jgi:2-polyprenyl-3-methyl-5-hydroxy-6-metoxy-1,4-benzoquinol methylase
MEKQHVCPWWLGYTFLIPLRKYQHDPYKILGPHVKQGMTVMDYGCAMGYFSIPLAKMTGSKGKVYCVDIQEKMLVKLKKRAIKHGVSAVIKTLQVGKNYHPTDLITKVDFVLLFMVAHEVPDQAKLFNDLYSMLKQGGKIIFVEPKGHVKPEDFEKSIQLAKAAGFKVPQEKPMKKGLVTFLIK